MKKKKAMSCAKWIKAPAAVLQGRIHIYSGPFMFMSLQKLSWLSGAKHAPYLCILMLDCECSFLQFSVQLPPSVPNIGSSIRYTGDLLRDRAPSKDRHELKKNIHTLQTSWRLLSLQLNSPKQGLFFFWLKKLWLCRPCVGLIPAKNFVKNTRRKQWFPVRTYERQSHSVCRDVRLKQIL